MGQIQVVVELRSVNIIVYRRARLQWPMCHTGSLSNCPDQIGPGALMEG